MRKPIVIEIGRVEKTEDCEKKKYSVFVVRIFICFPTGCGGQRVYSMKIDQDLDLINANKGKCLPDELAFYKEAYRLEAGQESVIFPKVEEMMETGYSRLVRRFEGKFGEYRSNGKSEMVIEEEK